MKSVESYTSASSFPVKLMHNNIHDNDKIKPYHIQLIPTNACDLNCEFCSCSDRDKKKKIPFEEIKRILDVSKEYGTKAVTITGGGEPMLYKQINETIDYALEKGMEVGLVSNGNNIDKLKFHDNLTWCRISSSDDRVPNFSKIYNAIQKNPNTGWAFSHVVTNNPNYEIIGEVIKFANDVNMTHVRLVSDLLNLKNVPDLSLLQVYFQNNFDDSKVIYQGRKDSTFGTKDCYISLLKPVIAPEGIFPCCGAQYAIIGQNRDYVDNMKMGELEDLECIFKEQKHFDGSVCDVCYYSQYNDALKKIKNIPEHVKFV